VRSVNYTKDSRKVEKQKTNASGASAWKEHRWEFENAPLKEVLQLLKDNYGFDASVEDADLWNKTISGTISSDNKDIVISGLSILLDIKIEQKNNTHSAEEITHTEQN
jgi:ferric-dicitrate binding protein FerR (iron transport regulator)